MLLRANQIYFSYGEHQVFRGLNFSATSGRVHAILGENGSGKSTLLYLLAGLLKPNQGEILLDNNNIETLSNYRRIAGIIFQNPEDQLFQATVRDELLFTLRQLELSEDLMQERLKVLIDRYGLEPFLDRNPFNLSYGEKKIVAYAAIIAKDPLIILLDEPFANLGAKYRRVIYEDIKNFRKKGRIVIFTTHEPLIALTISDEITLLRNGLATKLKEKSKLIKVAEEYNLSNPCDKLEVLRDYCRDFP